MSGLASGVTTPAEIEAALEACEHYADAALAARELLQLAERILEHWIVARGGMPTTAQREGFRLLALHRQGAQDVPSFNACRESCREIAYHYNLILGGTRGESDTVARHHRMMSMLVTHLYLFVSGKLQIEGLGEFCCASRPLRTEVSVQ